MVSAILLNFFSDRLNSIKKHDPIHMHFTLLKGLDESVLIFTIHNISLMNYNLKPYLNERLGVTSRCTVLKFGEKKFL